YHRIHRSIEFGLSSTEKRVHVIVPTDPIGEEIPIPGSGLGSFQRQSQPLLAGSECGVAFAKSRQHLVECVRQLPDLVGAMFGSTNRIIVTFRYGGGDVGQFENWQGDAPLQRRGDR